jgi:uncharacterized membrane protein
MVKFTMNHDMEKTDFKKFLIAFAEKQPDAVSMLIDVIADYFYDISFENQKVVEKVNEYLSENKRVHAVKFVMNQLKIDLESATIFVGNVKNNTSKRQQESINKFVEKIISDYKLY